MEEPVNLNTECARKKKGAILDKIYEANFSFCLKQRTTVNVQFLFFNKVLLVFTKFSFSKGN